MRYITIALAKGRIGDSAITFLEKAGFDLSDFKDDSRKLNFIDETNKIKFILVKPADVPIYVEYGIADIGIVGKDVLLEEEKDLYEPLDLGFGRCRIVVASLKGAEYNPKLNYKVATKFQNIALKYFSSKGIDVKIIKLSGSVELAPVTGLSDVIVDIVETGTTLEENGLEVKEIITEVSARVVVNKASMKTEDFRIVDILKKLEKVKREMKM